MARGLFWGAAAAGALYWASKQPGGVKGTWRRLRGAAREIQEGADPMETGRRFLKGRSTTGSPEADSMPGYATSTPPMAYER
jgi:hypothetical protein